MTTLPEIPGMTLAEWPSESESAIRRSLTDSARVLDDVRPLDAPPSRLLMLATWALAEVRAQTPDAPVLPALAAMLGLSRATLGAWRKAGIGGLDGLALPPQGGVRKGAGRHKATTE